ncbi:hypothetical protein TIFTF001_015279 [Ficus carica]|uniref:Endoplasmic reticulum transmembrane protein n=1 Tax=Ficus carica TaxID=3494 RepID=A0AA88D6E3_FICCA|nr:hypothetical protein TIFTF001_015279 [Ficus carica]
MALQWMILTYVVAIEAALAILLTLPYPKLLKNRVVSLVSLILQPCFFIVPFTGFQLLGLPLSSSLFGFRESFGFRWIWFLIIFFYECRSLLEERASLVVHL